MAHQRTTIRQAVAALLSGETAAETRVYTTRVRPYRKGDLPAISVYTLEETVSADGSATAPRELERDLQLVIEAWVSPSETVDDDLDDLALEIETAMHADPYLGGAVGDSMLAATTLGVLEDGDGIMGVATLTYDVIYRTMAPAAPAGLDDFLEAGVTYDLGGTTHADDQAEDLAVVQVVP